MGRYVFRLPDIGEGIAEAEIIAWHVSIGDRVKEDGKLADVMTDKATVEMESPVAGIVLELAGEVGDRIAIGAPLVVLEVEGAGNTDETEAESPAAPAPEAPAKPNPEAAERSVSAEPRKQGDSGKPPHGESPAKPATAPDDWGNASSGMTRRFPTSAARIDAGAGAKRKVLASPAVRQRARELGIDLSEIHPSQGERIRHADLDAFIAYNAAGGFQPAGRRGMDEKVRLIGLRRRISENMAEAKRRIAHFTYVEEYDVTALEAARAQLNEARGDRPKLTLLPFLITAICRLIPDFPMLNAHFDDEAGVVTRFGAVHMGIATQTAAGLMVPVIRNAQDRNLWQLAAEIARLAAAARDGSQGRARRLGRRGARRSIPRRGE
ncbi:MAG: 2-oxo acid dehydrogenase subunit E2 [Novosphingobium sp.]|nr:2-oxo acid dehydrogenase subunit E2 [Novosphingobium sp.]